MDCRLGHVDTPLSEAQHAVRRSSPEARQYKDRTGLEHLWRTLDQSESIQEPTRKNPGSTVCGSASTKQKARPVAIEEHEPLYGFLLLFERSF